MGGAEVWTSRCIPLMLLGVTGFSIYVIPYTLCISYLIHGAHRRPAAAIAIMTIYFMLLLPYLACFFRLLQTMSKPDYMPQKQNSKSKPTEKKQTSQWSCRARRDSRDDSAQLDRKAILGDGSIAPPRGIDRFYRKDVFLCDWTGLPLFCERGCNNWKPSRTHHCSQVDRCVRRMDHFCPWVGGVVSERNTNFFIQFTFYASLFCAFIFGVVLWAVIDQVRIENHLNGAWIAMCALGGLFLFMSGGMFLVTTFKNLWNNMTTVEELGQTYFLAVWLPSGDLPNTIARKQPLTVITYPLPREGLPNQSKRTFAVIECHVRDNLWDLGPLVNLKSVLGNRYIDWFLPIKYSPCCSRDGVDYDYPFGSVLQDRKREYGLVH